MNRTILIGAAVLALGLAAGYYFGYDQGWERAVKKGFSMNTSQSDTSATDVTYFENTNGFYAHPNDNGKHPGVVLVHEWWGLNDTIKQAAARLAGEGYHVLAVDLYKGQVATTSDRAMQLRTTLTSDQAVANMKAAVQFLKNKGADKVAVWGWCYGGGKALELSLSGVDLDATVIYYGTLVTDEDRLKAISWPVLGIFGGEDQSISTTTVRAFETALENLDIAHEIYIYPGVGHAFANPSNPNHAPAETADAWEKTTRFLAAHLQ